MTEDSAREAATTAADQAQRFERLLTGEATADDWADYGYDPDDIDDDEGYDRVAESILEGYAVAHIHNDYGPETQYAVAVTGTGGPHTELHAYPNGEVYGVGQDWGTPKVREYAGSLPVLADWLLTVFGGAV